MIHRYAFLPLLTLAFLCATAASAQTSFRISDGGTITTCEATFFDGGGPNGNHGAVGTTQTVTICGDGSTGTHVRLVFSQFEISGELSVWDAATASGPPFTVITDAQNGTFPIIRATAPNTSGCLTLQFEGMGTPRAGWRAAVECVTSCQDIEAQLVSTTPAADPPGPGGFINVCPGDPITFTGRGVYAQNGLVYSQSDADSRFIWNFQDGTVLEGQTVTYAYPDPGAYLVQLTVEDSRGCRNANRIDQAVRVAPDPIFGNGGIPDRVCPGEEVILRTGTSASGPNSISAAPRVFGFNTDQTLTELTELPDGTGVEYSSPLIFTNFNPGQVLTAGSELVQICASMEHSYLGDLDIWIECPNGSRLDLHRYDPNDPVARQLLGQGDPVTTTPDPPGRYCWTATAPATMTQVVISESIGDEQSMPERDYAAEESFNTLAGCPLNGEWTLNIRDNILADNGYIYEWSIEFISSVYPDQAEFSVDVTELEFENHGNYTSFGTDQVSVNTTNPGYQSVRVLSTDEYGCTSDTTFRIEIRSPFDPDCVTCGDLVARDRMDTLVCEGNNFEPNVATDVPTVPVTYQTVTNDAFGEALYDNRSSAYEPDIEVRNHFPTRFVDATTGIESVCVSLENDGDLSDVRLELVSPDGTRLSLLRGTGGNGEDLRNTCFAPLAADPPNGGSPYTGVFRADDNNWATFNGDNINGTWVLRAWDEDGNDLGRFVQWSITLRYDEQRTYSWSPTTGLSCTDCPNPTITPNAPTVYTLTVNTAYGCSDEAVVDVEFNTLDIEVDETITPPRCFNGDDGRIVLTVGGADAAGVTFSWDDGGTTDTRANVRAGVYNVTITGANGCLEAYAYTVGEPEELTIDGVEENPTSCFQGADGSATVNPVGGTPPYFYQWDDPLGQTRQTAVNLAAGIYNVTVTDDNGCLITASALILEPDQLTVALTTTPVRCVGANEGTATATPGGGTAGYTYLWSNGDTEQTATDLPQGSVSVTVTDANGCTTTGSAVINQPAVILDVNVSQDDRGCFGASENVATVTAAGGGGAPYTYAWSNGETTATATALPAGLVTVSVTDAGGCTQAEDIQINDLAEVEINLLLNAPTCNGRSDGSIGADPSGGAGLQTTDYQFAWSNGATTPVITGLAGGVVYSVTVTGPRGCVGTAERLLPMPPGITFRVEETTVVCTGESNGGLRVFDVSGPNPGDYTFQWGPAAGNATTNQISGLPAGEYALTVTDVGTCELDTVLTINEPPPLEPTIEQTNVSCFGEGDGVLRAGGTGGVGGYGFAWSDGRNTATIGGLVAGTYTLTLTDINDCENVSEYTITQPEALSIEANPTAVLCEGDATGRITLVAGGGTGPFAYTVEGIGTTRNATFLGLPAGVYSTSIQDANGCRIGTDAVVEDGPFFGVDLGPDSTIIFGDSILLVPELMGGVDSLRYDWQPSYPGTLSCDSCATPFAKPEYEIDYTLVVTDATGCVAEDRVRVSVGKIRNVAVPTGFSPNGDGQNDRLIVHGRPGTVVEYFSVYDRWTNLLFEDAEYPVNDRTRGWDGRYEGEPVDGGVYLYRMVIRYEDGSKENLSGQTTLIR